MEMPTEFSITEKLMAGLKVKRGESIDDVARDLGVTSEILGVWMKDNSIKSMMDGIEDMATNFWRKNFSMSSEATEPQDMEICIRENALTIDEHATEAGPAPMMQEPKLMAQLRGMWSRHINSDRLMRIRLLQGQGGIAERSNNIDELASKFRSLTGLSDSENQPGPPLTQTATSQTQNGSSTNQGGSTPNQKTGSFQRDVDRLCSRFRKLGRGGPIRRQSSAPDHLKRIGLPKKSRLLTISVRPYRWNARNRNSDKNGANTLVIRWPRPAQSRIMTRINSSQATCMTNMEMPQNKLPVVAASLPQVVPQNVNSNPIPAMNVGNVAHSTTFLKPQ